MIETRIENNIAILSWNLRDSSMNVLNQLSMQAFGQAIDEALANEAVKGIIVTSAKREFIAGGDLKAIFAMQARAEVTALAMGLNGILRKLETGGKPVVAAINGLALGGGYEVALACHHRILLDHPAAKVGLPEVTLGLLPGGGGTQRLPRLIGIQPALQPLLEGRQYRPAQALKIGMVDQLASSKEDLLAKAKKWIEEVGTSVQPWDQKGFQIPGGGVNGIKGMTWFSSASGMVREKTQGNYPGPYAILNAVYEGLQLTLDRALEVEANYFADLVTSPVAKNMIRTLFFAMNRAKAGVARPKNTEVPDVNKVGILGAGMMGAGIAYVSAKAGIESILKDVSDESAAKGKDYSRKLLDKALGRKRTTPEKAEALLNLIHPTGDPNQVEGSDMIIEAVFEDRKLKAKVTQESEAVLPDHAVFASNTSTLPITGLAEASKRPERFIGLHFFSPVDKMQLVEIILGQKTDDYALAMAVDYVLKIKKVPIVVNDSRSFYTSRIFKTYVVEGLEMLAEGIKPALIENCGKMAGMPVGPLAVTDEVSLDLIYRIYKQTEKDGIIPEGEAKPVVVKMVEEFERLGRKSGKGFYEYPEGGKKHLWKELKTHFPVRETQPNAVEVKRRLLHVQAAESLKCLTEGVLFSAEDGDIGSILGWGFPPYTGGTFSYINFVGAQHFIRECQELSAQFGKRFSLPQSFIDFVQLQSNPQNVDWKTFKKSLDSVPH